VDRVRDDTASAEPTVTERARAAGSADRFDLPLDGIRLSALRWTPTRPTTPPPVLLHHGLASSAGFWGPTAAHLAAGVDGRASGAAGDDDQRAAVTRPDPSPGHRVPSGGPAREVVALDARGHGESDRPDDGYRTGQVATDLQAALVELGWTEAGMARPVLVGHSWGGNVVLEHAARHPGVAAGIVLVDGGFLELGHMTWEETERDLAPPRMGPMTWTEFTARAAGWWGATGWSDAVEQAIHHNFEELPDGTIRPRLSRERHMAVLRGMWEQRPSELYGSVRVPVLLLPARRSGADGRERQFIERKAQAIERAVAALGRSGVPVTVEWFEESIHDIPLQHPARLAARIQAFVAALPA
jgi:pimeloyl-ACP methyl ester carboxylesterase